MADVKALALNQDLVVVESGVANGVRVEVLGGTDFIPYPELSAKVVGRAVLVMASQNPPVRQVKVEVLADDTSFVPPPELRSAVVGRSVLALPPLVREFNKVTVEVLAEVELDPIPAARGVALEQDIVYEEIQTPLVHSFQVEALAVVGLEQEINRTVVEVLGDDTSPNSVHRYAVEVLGDSTDPVDLTQQQIIWFFNLR